MLHSTTDRGQAMRLGLLFAALYFVQGIAEPTEGLIAQPVRSLLADLGKPVDQIARFWALIALPWALKPFYGVLTDHVPFLARRRKSYLILMVSLAALAYGYLAAAPLSDSTTALFWCLLLSVLGVAFSDVVIDALMIEHGQPRGLTGRFQSIQWAAIYTGSILTGWLGGKLTADHDTRLGFLICAAALSLSLVVCFWVVREQPVRRRTDLVSAARHLRDVLRLPVVWSAGGFIWLWNFNPFSSVVLQSHMTQRLDFSEQFYGETLSLQAIGSVAASLAYGLYCRRVRFSALLHTAIVLGIASTLAYWSLDDVASARWISLAVGFTYMSATLMQLDLAARACPLASAGTVFASLMALSNLSTALSTWLGGVWYIELEDRYGAIGAFNTLVGIGALFTAGCWLLVPLVNRTLASVEENVAHNGKP